jgi:hypothetical protein
MLLKQRRAVSVSVVATAAGGDLDLTLVLADGGPRGCADSAFAAHADPIAHWAMAVWGSRLPRLALLRLTAAAMRRLASALRVWAAVKLPAVAFVASSARLGWTVHDAFTVTVEAGTLLRLNKMWFPSRSAAGVGGRCPCFRLINPLSPPE